MTIEQLYAVRSAHDDLVESYRSQLHPGGHDWRAHLQSILDLENAFPRAFRPGDLFTPEQQQNKHQQ